MDFILGMVVGAIVTFFYWRQVVIRAIDEIAERVVEQVAEQQTEPKTILQVTVEQCDDQFLLYRADTNKFVMQGRTMQDFQGHLKQLKIDELNIVNGASDAAQALIAVSKELKEQSENSRNQ